MKMAKKFKIILVLFIVIIFSVIAARYATGLHFKQKFSKRPPPGVITTTVNESIFYKSIETFGTVIALNSKNYRIKNDDIEGNFTREGKFVKKGDVIIELKSTEKIIADFSGKLGMREIAQGVLGSDSIIITLDDLQKVIIDIKGCFWHQHGCIHSKLPKSNQIFWMNKFEKIKIKDFQNLTLNKEKGWKTFEIWECVTNDKIKLNEEINKVLQISEIYLNIQNSNQDSTDNLI